MALLSILTFPDPRLRKKAKPVEYIDDDIKQLVSNMFDTMYHNNGIGLAATQINVHKQIIVMDISAEHNQPNVFVNPEISIIDQTLFEYKEGCLSVPDYLDMVKRPRKVNISYMDINGQQIETEAEGLLSVCIQHEIDHLNGRLFIDYLSQLKRDRIKKTTIQKSRNT